MATGNVGNLNVKLTLSAEQFAAALLAAGGDVNSFALKVDQAQKSTRSMAEATTAVQRTTQQASGGVNRLGQAFTGLAYGAQDFASQLGSRGVGGGLQAIANNIPMIAAAMPGWGSAAALAASVAVQGLGLFIEMQDRATKKAKELKDASEGMFGSRLDSMLGKFKGAQSFERELSQATRPGVSATERFDKLTEMAGTRGDTINSANGQLRILAQERAAAAETFARNQAKIEQAARAGFGGNIAAAEAQRPKEVELRNKARDQLDEIAKRERELIEARDEAQRQLDRIRQTIPEAARQMRTEEEKAATAAAEEERKRRYEMMRNTQGSRVAPGIAAASLGTSEAFSQVQAALRASKTISDTNGKTISDNTKKTADNTRDIANAVKRIKVATIA